MLWDTRFKLYHITLVLKSLNLLKVPQFVYIHCGVVFLTYSALEISPIIHSPAIHSPTTKFYWFFLILFSTLASSPFVYRATTPWSMWYQFLEQTFKRPVPCRSFPFSPVNLNTLLQAISLLQHFTQDRNFSMNFSSCWLPLPVNSMFTPWFDPQILILHQSWPSKMILTDLIWILDVAFMWCGEILEIYIVKMIAQFSLSQLCRVLISI